MHKPQIVSYRYSIIPAVQQESGAVLVFVLVLTVILSLAMGALSLSSQYSLKKSSQNRESVSALNIAEAGKEIALAKLRDRTLNLSLNRIVSPFTNQPFGLGMYTVRCSTSTALDTATIFSTGVQGSDTSKIEVVVNIQPDVWQRWIKGMVTARTDVSTLGTIEIDGRDYDTNSMFGTLLGTGGTYGVAAGGSVSAGGNSKIGGYTTAPQQPALPGQTVVQNFDTTNYPQEPEQLLGLAPGALEPYKCTTCPPTSFVGIVYSEVPCDIAGGIMIVHNASGTASLGNFHDHFKGLIIADVVDKFNGGSSVLGAVFMLGRTTGSHTFGNGTAKLHFSSKMLEKVMTYLPATGRRTVNVISWREVN